MVYIWQRLFYAPFREGTSPEVVNSLPECCPEFLLYDILAAEAYVGMETQLMTKNILNGQLQCSDQCAIMILM
jgi:hypothetical protein